MEGTIETRRRHSPELKGRVLAACARLYTTERNGPRFHRVGAPDPQALDRLLNRLVRRLVRRLTRDGLLIQNPEQPWLDLEYSDSLDQLNAASIRYRLPPRRAEAYQTPTDLFAER